MSDLMTRDPQAVLQALRDAGACQVDAKPPAQSCPAEQYCALSGGQTLCLRTLDQAATTGPGTAAGSTGTRAEVAQPATPAPVPRGITELEVLSVFVVFVAGITVGRYWPRRR